MANPVLNQRHTSDSWWHPTDYLRIVYKRRWAALPAFLLVFVSGALDTIRAVPIYQARTQLLIERDTRRQMSVDAIVDERSGSYYDDGFYTTQYNVLRSRSLALRVVEALEKSGPPEVVPPAPGMSFSLSGLLGYAQSQVWRLFSNPPAVQPQPAAAPAVADGVEPSAESPARLARAGRFLGSLNVVPVRNSSLVNLVFNSPDPHYAARAVNELANQYRARNLESRVMDTKETNDFLSQQLKEQRAKLEASEAALLRYKETHNAASVDDRQNIVVQRLTELSAQVTKAKIERLDKEALYNQLLEAQKSGTRMDSIPMVVANEYIQKTKLEIANLEERRSQMAAQYGPNWPAMKEVASSLAVARQRLANEIDGVVNASRTDYLAARAKEDSLAAALNAQKGESMGLDRKAVEYAALEREAAADRQLFENLMQRTKETGISGQYRNSNIQIIDTAQVPSSPVLPNVPRDLMVSMMTGLVLAIGLVFAFEYFDSRIKSPDEIKAHLNIPFLGLVPSVPLKDGDQMLLGAMDVPPAFAEAIKAIRTGVVFSSAEEGSRSVVVTSTAPHEGKTVVSSNLAAALAQTDQKVLIIDADMRRPRIHEVFGWLQDPGLSNVLVGTSTLADAVRKSTVPNLSVLPAGHIPPNPAELLGAQRFKDLLKELGRQYDWVIIDAPPVMAVTDAALVGNIATGVVFVVGAEMTSRRHAAVAVEQLAAAQSRFIGAVLNRANVQRHGYYYSTYYRKDYVRAYTRS
jgi:succinoglycan biosynthesis transport protein ExoP